MVATGQNVLMESLPSLALTIGTAHPPAGPNCVSWTACPVVQGGRASGEQNCGFCLSYESISKWEMLICRSYRIHGT